VIQIQRNPWTACPALAGLIPYNNPRAPAYASAQSSQIKKRDHLVIVVRDTYIEGKDIILGIP
jgi:hypothetical protein